MELVSGVEEWDWGAGLGSGAGEWGWGVWLGSWVGQSTPLPNPTPTCSRRRRRRSRRRRRRRRRRPRRHDNDEDVDDNDDYYHGYEDNDEENNNVAISVASSAKELLVAGHRSARLREAPMAAMFLEAEDGGLGSSMVRAPMTPSSLLEGEKRINDLAERIHDLESGMRRAFQNLGELRQQQAALYSWVEWFGRIRHWMANCARTFPGR